MLNTHKVLDLSFCFFIPTGPAICVTVLGSVNTFVNMLPQSRMVPYVDLQPGNAGISIPIMGAVRTITNLIPTHRIVESVIGSFPIGWGLSITGSANTFIGS